MICRLGQGIACLLRLGDGEAEGVCGATLGVYAAGGECGARLPLAEPPELDELLKRPGRARVGSKPAAVGGGALECLKREVAQMEDPHEKLEQRPALNVADGERGERLAGRLPVGSIVDAFDCVTARLAEVVEACGVGKGELIPARCHVGSAAGEHLVEGVRGSCVRRRGKLGEGGGR